MKRSKPIIAAGSIPLVLLSCMIFVISFTTGTAYASEKPNILVIWGDDIGYWNISAYNMGMMGYKTPNIDRIAKEGAIFTDYYGEQSCTAARASFILGQLPFRTGLSKVGMPGAKKGINASDPTIAELLKNHGYATGQFGKNHLGDRNEYLPTVHGFDEFFGNLYHLNAEEEPESIDYPKAPTFMKKFGPRGVLHAWATTKADRKDEPRWGVVGKQRIENTGQLTTKRMETIDDEFLAGAIKFIDKAHKEGKPFFVWANTSRMHNYTHLPKEYQDMVAEKGFYGAGMTQHDRSVGQLLAKLDDLGITENTIVIYSTDNGAMKFSWPDGGTSPFRGEKATTWEAGFRVPCMVRWPGVVKPGTIINDIFHHMDWMPTLLAALGEPDLKEKLLKGHKAAGKTFKVHLDGYNQLPVLKGQRPSTRQEIWYISDDGDLCALRYNKWKITFLKQEAVGRNVWVNNYTPLRAPELTDLRADPFEHASKPGYSMGWEDWWFRRAYLFVPAQGVVAGLVKSFKEFPPRGKPASFSVGDALKMIEDAHSGSGK